MLNVYTSVTSWWLLIKSIAELYRGKVMTFVLPLERYWIVLPLHLCMFFKSVIQVQLYKMASESKQLYFLPMFLRSFPCTWSQPCGRWGPSAWWCRRGCSWHAHRCCNRIGYWFLIFCILTCIILSLWVPPWDGLVLCYSCYLCCNSMLYVTLWSNRG